MYHTKDHNKPTKANDKSLFDSKTGRVLKGHQSDFDLELILAASGATMHVGLTARNVDKSLLALWWKPGKRMDRVQLELAECIFYDIVEADHIIPKRFKARLQPLAQTPQQQYQQQPMKESSEVEGQRQEGDKQLEEERRKKGAG